MSRPNEDIAALMAAATAREDAGDAAAKDALFAALYDELHRLAQSHLRRTGGSLTISATTLLHEAYLDLAGRAAVAFPDRNRFLGYASRAMRGLIIDYVRHRGALKRGGELTFTSLEDHHAPPDGGSVDLERLGGALEELAAIDPQLAELVDLKFFCGFSLVEIAGMRGVSERTVRRDWTKARTLLHQSLEESLAARRRRRVRAQALPQPLGAQGRIGLRPVCRVEMLERTGKHFLRRCCVAHTGPRRRHFQEREPDGGRVPLPRAALFRTRQAALRDAQRLGVLAIGIERSGQQRPVSAAPPFRRASPLPAWPRARRAQSTARAGSPLARATRAVAPSTCPRE